MCPLKKKFIVPKDVQCSETGNFGPVTIKDMQTPTQKWPSEIKDAQWAKKNDGYN